MCVHPSPTKIIMALGLGILADEVPAQSELSNWPSPCAYLTSWIGLVRGQEVPTQAFAGSATWASVPAQRHWPNPLAGILPQGPGMGLEDLQMDQDVGGTDNFKARMGAQTAVL